MREMSSHLETRQAALTVEAARVSDLIQAVTRDANADKIDNSAQDPLLLIRTGLSERAMTAVQILATRVQHEIGWMTSQQDQLYKAADGIQGFLKEAKELMERWQEKKKRVEMGIEVANEVMKWIRSGRLGVGG